jgi:hypothetical protein
MSPTPGQSIRRFCVACVGSPHDLKKCGGDKCLGGQGDKHGTCYLYPYRLGKGRPSLKLIRKVCLECMEGSGRLVAECVARECHLYAYRFGQRPKRDGIPENFAESDREGGLSASRIDDLIAGVVMSTQDPLEDGGPLSRIGGS